MRSSCFAAVLAVLAALFIVYVFKASRATEAKGRDAAIAAGEFLQGLQSADRPIGDLECSEKGCRETERLTPHYAWRMLAFASLFQSTGDEKYKTRVREEFHHYQTALSTVQSHTTLWQVFEAYHATGDAEILSHFLNASMFFSLQLDLAPKGGLYYESEVMSTATFARELLFAAQSFSDPNTTVALENAKLKRPLHRVVKMDQWPAGFKNQADLMYQSAKRKEKEGAVMVPWEPNIRAESCWIQFAEMARYKVLGEESALERVADFMKRMGFREHGRFEYDVQVLQMILPCIHALKELAELRPIYEADLHAALERFLMPSFDADSRVLCHGDGSFLTLTKQRPGLSCANVKSTADNSWAVALLAADNSVFKMDDSL